MPINDDASCALLRAWVKKKEQEHAHELAQEYYIIYEHPRHGREWLVGPIYLALSSDEENALEDEMTDEHGIWLALKQAGVLFGVENSDERYRKHLVAFEQSMDELEHDWDDEIASRESWNDTTDAWVSERRITQEEYNTWDNPY